MKFIASTFLLLFFFSAQAQVVSSEPTKTIKGLKSRVTYIQYTPKEDKVVAGFETYAAAFDLGKGKKTATFEHDYNGVKAVYYCAFDGNGDHLLTIDAKGKKRFWEMASGKLAKVNAKNNFGPDPREIIALGLKSGNSESDYFYTQKEVDLPGKKVKAKAGKRGVISFVNTETGDVLQKITLPNSDPFHMPPCYISPDGAYFVTGTDKGELLFYSID